MKKPTIGIILDWQEKGSFSRFEYFALRTHYINATRLAGGIAWLIPYSKVEEIDDYLDKIDGLIVPGGQYKTPDEWYIGIDEISPYEKSPRFIFEEEVIKRALQRDMPLLGICAGMQVMSGILGAKLTSNIHKYLPQALPHFNFTSDHDIEIIKDSLLSKIVKKDIININSDHNEAVVKVPENILISARSTDGCVEAIEIKGKKFALGVEWHPELCCFKEAQISDSNPDYLIFKAFIEACI